jgi:hypothetical protein
MMNALHSGATVHGGQPNLAFTMQKRVLVCRGSRPSRSALLNNRAVPIGPRDDPLTRGRCLSSGRFTRTMCSIAICASTIRRRGPGLRPGLHGYCRALERHAQLPPQPVANQMYPREGGRRPTDRPSWSAAALLLARHDVSGAFGTPSPQRPTEPLG